MVATPVPIVHWINIARPVTSAHQVVRLMIFVILQSSVQEEDVPLDIPNRVPIARHVTDGISHPVVHWKTPASFIPLSLTHFLRPVMNTVLRIVRAISVAPTASAATPS